MAILEFLNIRDGSTLHEVCQETGLTRGTVYRILETLRQGEFIRKDTGSPRYWLSNHVLALSDGYKEEWWIEKFASKIIHDLGQEIRWPVRLLTSSGHELVIRVSTDFETHFTDGKYPAGFRISLPGTASGQVYLAYSDEVARSILLRAVVNAPPPTRRRTTPAKYHQKDLAMLPKVMAQIRQDGYRIVDQKGTAYFSMAVPVLVKDMPLGVIASFFFRSAVKPQQAIQKYLPLLQKAAGQISEKISNQELPGRSE